MLPMLGIYRSPDRQIFFRTSASAGRTLEFEINAESWAHLEVWLMQNGFELLRPSEEDNERARRAGRPPSHKLC